MNYVYVPKMIWFKGYRGSTHGAYHIHALVSRKSAKDTDLKSQTRLFAFVFRPHKDRKDLHICNIKEDQISDDLRSMLFFFTEELLANPSTWKKGNNKLYFSQSSLGQFQIDQGFCFIPGKYQYLMDLDRSDFEQLVNEKHPLFSLINNNTKDFDQYYRGDSIS